MNSVTVNEVSYEFESALSEILPDLYQLLQHYQVSSPLEIHLFGLADDSVSSDRSCFCDGFIQKPCRCGITSDPLPIGLDSEKAQQLLEDVDSKLSTILPCLSQSAQQIDKSFEVHFLIEPAKANSGQLVACQWICDNILKCSDS
ncbi:hypothetical protein [Phormidesmis sp. 146-33]